MPTHPTWFQRLPQIIGALEALTKPFLDRRDLQQLLTIRPRQANALMKMWSPTTIRERRMAVIERPVLLRVLTTLAGDPTAIRAIQNRERVELSIAEALQQHRTSLSVGVARKPDRSLESLARTSIQPPTLNADGVLTIRFKHSRDLLERLAELAVTIQTDEDAFYRKAGADPDAATITL